MTKSNRLRRRKREFLRIIFGQEVWKWIKGYEGLYKVSSHGRIKSSTRLLKSKKNRRQKSYTKLHNGRILRPGGVKYKNVQLSKNGVVKSYEIHRLVAETFLSALRENCKQEVNHKDLNRQNNRYSNLEWLSHQDNCHHAKMNGGVSKKISRTFWKEIGRRLKAGEPATKISFDFGVTPGAIYYIKRCLNTK